MTSSSLEIRRRLSQIVQRFPGLHLRELAREADLSPPLAEYHLDVLERDHLVESRIDGSFRRFHPLGSAAPTEGERALIQLLRQRVPLQITVYLLEHEVATHKELTQALGLAKSTVSYHLKKLQENGLLISESRKDTFRLRESKLVERLLLRWTPQSSLTDRFSELWEDFYRRKKG